jgi:hypothetical protein
MPPSIGAWLPPMIQGQLRVIAGAGELLDVVVTLIPFWLTG